MNTTFGKSKLSLALLKKMKSSIGLDLSFLSIEDTSPFEDVARLLRFYQIPYEGKTFSEVYTYINEAMNNHEKFGEEYWILEKVLSHIEHLKIFELKSTPTTSIKVKLKLRKKIIFKPNW